MSSKNKATHPNTDNSNNTNGNAGEMVDVLYQKMGNRWFAFSLIDDEVFVGSLTEEEINGMNAAPAATAAPTAEASIVDDERAPSASKRRRGNA